MNNSATSTSTTTVTSQQPPRILRQGKVVIVLNGRHAGKKAFIVNPCEGQVSKTRAYSHALIVGISKAPSRITRSMSKKKISRRSRIKPFVKLINYNHIMPTRYSIDIDVKSIVSVEVASDPSKRKDVLKTVAQKLQDKYNSGSSKWFFSKLRF